VAKTKAGTKTDFWCWAFESSGRNPLSWQASAKDLFEGAEAVKDRVPTYTGLMPTLASVQALLLGLALECLLKALWIKSRKAWLDEHKEFSLTRDGKYIGIPKVKDHDLLAIANAANLKATAKERAVLGRLSGFVLFAGRYPIAKTVDLTRPRRTGRGPKTARGYITMSELAIGEDLAKRLMKEVEPWR
jgi:hypothetical protein